MNRQSRRQRAARQVRRLVLPGMVAATALSSTFAQSASSGDSRSSAAPGHTEALLLANARSTAGMRDATDIRGKRYESVAPMNETVTGRILPQVYGLLDQLLRERRAMRLDGVEVFRSDDHFLPGKIALGLALLLIDTRRDDPRLAGRLAGFREMAQLTIDDTNDTWGIYYYVLALHKLQRAGLLEQAVSPDTLTRLRAQLDWRRFVRESDLTLIKLPTNYYGVAFSVARLRMLLGWDSAAPSEALLAKTLEHYRTYSGEYGFSDETDGDGRFDRYSVLLIGEFAERFIETGMQPTEEVRRWLRKSVDVLLPRLNMRGEGFEYGRSIGTYGETALLEVLAAAATLNVLTDEEKEMAYAFSSRVAARYADFWIDPRTHSVNLWDNGRRTDAYRGKHRILGENLSLAGQFHSTNELWNRLRFENRAPSPRFERWLRTLPTSTVTWFARGEYDRLLITYRDSDRVIGLPLINGGRGQHNHNPYFPVPFSPGMLQGSPDANYPQLVPRFTLADGSIVMPLAYFKDVRIQQQGSRTIVTYRQDELDRMGQPAPVKDNRIQVETRYELAPGRILRTDRYTAPTPVTINQIDIELGTFSGQATVRGHTIRFGTGDLREFGVEGFDRCEAQAVAGAEPYATPVGPLQTRVVCSTTGTRSLDKPLTLSWTLKHTP